MPISDDLLDGVVSALGGSIRPSLTSVGAASDLFEAYAFAILVQAAKKEGAQVTFRDPNNRHAREFVFRTSPGYIWSNTHPYTYACIVFPDCEPLEAHLGVRVSGKSGVLHEFDVCVLRRSEAVTARQDHVHPRQSKVIVGVECKFYATHLNLGLARSFIGLGSDVTAKRMYFVTNTSSLSVEKLLTARSQNWANQIYPGSTNEIDKLRSGFQTAFKYYLSS